MLTDLVTILSIFQIVFLVCATYFTFKIARADFTPSRPWYLLSLAKLIFIVQKILGLFYLGEVRKIAIQYGGIKIFISSFLQTIVFLAIFIGMAELYAILKTKNHDS